MSVHASCAVTLARCAVERALRDLRDVEDQDGRLRAADELVEAAMDLRAAIECLARAGADG